MSDENRHIREVANGSEEALKALYDLYSAQLYTIILTYTKNQEDAQELLQDVFVSVYNSAKNFKFGSSVSTWIYRIGINKSIDFLRKKSTKQRKGLLSLYRKDSLEIEYDNPDFVHPGVQMEQQEDAKILFRVIDKLPINQRTAFILTQIDNLPQKEVAEIMGISRKAVESLLQRAKINLRKELEKYFPERGILTKNTTK